MMNTATILKIPWRPNNLQFSKQESVTNEIESLCNPLRRQPFLAVFCKTAKQKGKVLRTSENANKAAIFSYFHLELNAAATYLS